MYFNVSVYNNKNKISNTVHSILVYKYRKDESLFTDFGMDQFSS